MSVFVVCVDDTSHRHYLLANRFVAGNVMLVSGFVFQIPGGMAEDSELLTGVMLNKDVLHPKMRRSAPEVSPSSLVFSVMPCTVVFSRLVCQWVLVFRLSCVCGVVSR